MLEEEEKKMIEEVEAKGEARAEAMLEDLFADARAEAKAKQRSRCFDRERAVVLARAELGVRGGDRCFLRKGTPLYKKAKTIYQRLRRDKLHAKKRVVGGRLAVRGSSDFMCHNCRQIRSSSDFICRLISFVVLIHLSYFICRSNPIVVV